MSPDRYLPRIVDAELSLLFPALDAISIEGARGVGKTRTASGRVARVLDCQVPQVVELLEARPESLTDGAQPVLIDEWQRYPPSWDLVRRAVDAKQGSYLLTGSAPPANWPMHSGAGRIVSIRMRPMTLSERGFEQPTVSVAELLSGARPQIAGETTRDLIDYTREIVRGGFPAIRNASAEITRAALDGYLDRIVEREFSELGSALRNPGALRRWLTAYAAATSSTATFEKIRDAATPGEGSKPARSTTIHYRDTLEALWIIDPLPGWLPYGTGLNRLNEAPKHHLADPALAARLLGVDEAGLLSGDRTARSGTRNFSLLGALFESLVTLNLRVGAQGANAKAHHLRTKGGEHEVDIILSRDDRKVVAVEVKLAQSVGDDDVRHLNWLRTQIGGDLIDAVIVTSGSVAYRRKDGIAVVPAALLGP